MGNLITKINLYETDKAAQVVPLAPETPDERLHFEEGEQLNRLRKKNRRIDLFKGFWELSLFWSF